jgi:hypothetical protein
MEPKQAFFGMYELLAILGALAWLPQLFNWIRNLLAKPNLTIISDKELEIGFTSSGPILNVRLAFLAENKKALIKNIEVELMHEKKETQKFSWDWFEETLYEMDVPTTGLLPTKKNQKAIAINVDKDQLVEKKIGFQQNAFKQEHKRLSQTTIEESLNLVGAGHDIALIKSRKPYNDLLDHYKNSFSWKMGTYNAKFVVTIAEKKITFVHTFEFKLTTLDIKSLEANVDQCKLLAEQKYVDPNIQVDRAWFWVYPSRN